MKIVKRKRSHMFKSAKKRGKYPSISNRKSRPPRNISVRIAKERGEILELFFHSAMKKECRTRVVKLHRDEPSSLPYFIAEMMIRNKAR